MNDEAALARWIEEHIGGRVVRVQRLARWRPAWDIDVETSAGLLALHARGEREARIAMPYRIADEVATHDLLEYHGVPVPHAYGLCEAPYALVMTRLAGHADLSIGTDDAQRERLIGEYLELLARVYAIPTAAATKAGFQVPDTPEAAALGGFWSPMLRVYAGGMRNRAADPIAMFLDRWLRQNVPADRVDAIRFTTYDSFQFMFDDDRITGLLDFEHAHVGDPMMDLAALRVRDTIKHIGDLSATAQRYEAVTGIAIDHDVVEYHTVLYNALSVISTGPPLAEPFSGTDWLSYLAWYVNGARWAFESIAEIRGYELDRVATPPSRPTRHAPGVRYLTSELRRRATTDDYELAGLGRIANHLKRVDEIGAALDAADLDELSDVLGHRPDPHEADAELLALVETSGPDREEELVRLLDHRAQRMHLSMASANSLMLRHPRLRSLRTDRPARDDPDDGWPPGSIPGTR